jgi:hypothetical protein
MPTENSAKMAALISGQLFDETTGSMEYERSDGISKSKEGIVTVGVFKFREVRCFPASLDDNSFVIKDEITSKVGEDHG